MDNTLEKIITSPSLIREQWLSSELAVREVLAFERRFGHQHLKLACHSALPSILNPQLINLIHLNFLEDKKIPWIAEVDFLLSPLCRNIDGGLYEVEPSIREVLLVELENIFGWERPFEVARFLQFYLNHNIGFQEQKKSVRTQRLIAQAYIDPDQAIEQLTNLLNSSISEDYSNPNLSEQIYVTTTIEVLAEPLERTNMQKDYAYLVNNSRILSQIIYEDENELKRIISVDKSHEKIKEEILNSLSPIILKRITISEEKQIIANNSSQIDSLKATDQALSKRFKRETKNFSEEEIIQYTSKYMSSNITKDDKKSKIGMTLGPLLEEIDNHIENLELQSYNPITAENYLWLCDTAITWEDQLSDILYISKNISLADAPSNILPVLSLGNTLSEDEINQRIDSIARISTAYRLRIDQNLGKSSELYIKELDWHRAEVLFVNDILDGTIDFPKRINSHSFWRLEKIWMSEVQELEDYFYWQATGHDSHSSSIINHYLKDWTFIQQKLTSTGMKLPPSKFRKVKLYLEDNYVTFIKGHYKFDENKIERNGTNNILKIKSTKLREEAGKLDTDRYWDNQRNWFDVRQYVKQYYENIIPAVIDGNKECAQEVISAFDYSIKGKYQIINVFELAIASYFIHIETLQGIPYPEH